MADVITMQQQSGGLFGDMLDWFEHPRFTRSDPIDWLAFAVVLILIGLMWSKVVKQTLDVGIEKVSEIAA